MGSALELYSYIHLLLETWLFLKYIYIFFTDENGNFVNRGIGDGLGSWLPQNNLGISSLEVIVYLIPPIQIHHVSTYTQF